MKDEASIVEQYADSDVGERIAILIRYYPNFIRLVEGFEQNLSFIIKQEKEMKRRSAIGELGVRVQNSHISDPTAREAIGEKMERKRRLLKARLEKEFTEQGIHKEVKVDSLLVFSNPKGVKINVHDQFKQENYCFRGSLFNRIDYFTSDVEYTDEELAKVDAVLEKIETEQKRFTLKFNPEELKKSFAEAVVKLTENPAEENLVNFETERKGVAKNEKKATSASWVRGAL